MIKQTTVKGGEQVKVSFIIPGDAVDGKVSVVGDFNGWDPTAHPLRPAATAPAARPSPCRAAAASPSATWPRATAGWATSKRTSTWRTASAA